MDRFPDIRDFIRFGPTKSSTMFNFLFGNSKLKNALRHGAVIIDLRSPGEFDQGRIPDSINIPSDRISINLSRIKAMNVPIILTGYSDSIREARYKLESHGVKEVYSGGHWTSVLKIVRSL
ncbi:rhodanese-like domain-containing protein [Terrimonas sp. NA20]|uniref:Rhodanese-like domain-containing protein n=1 Tax=Terrimonas ginsenosidimutans TaxID=2908004 RepID=A0ABS9KVS0_9BACT|nr:rhodanese-like domain-containing protein [Terrimonas ginsenosidimutans]MCG2616444.1 rhodanese-like domain-containing protein [Terrimonas ginsenosidimutans]